MNGIIILVHGEMRFTVFVSRSACNLFVKSGDLDLYSAIYKLLLEPI